MRILLVIICLCTMACERPLSQEEKDYFLDVKGNEIHVKTTGQGPPIIFAHGGYLDLEMWNAQIADFRNENRLIRFSDLGHGKTKSAGESVIGHEIIGEIAKVEQSEKIILVGLSWGAMLCVDFAIHYPEKVDKMILISPGLNGWPYFKDELARQNNERRQEAIKERDTLRAAELFHQNWVVGPKRNKDDLKNSFTKESLGMIYGNMKEHRLSRWSNLDTIQAISRLEEIDVKTFIIMGDQDAEDIKQIADEYESRVVGARKIVLPNVAHLLTMENTTSFNQILKEILRE